MEQGTHAPLALGALECWPICAASPRAPEFDIDEAALRRKINPQKSALRTLAQAKVSAAGAIRHRFSTIPPSAAKASRTARAACLAMLAVGVLGHVDGQVIFDDRFSSGVPNPQIGGLGPFAGFGENLGHIVLAFNKAKATAPIASTIVTKVQIPLI